MSRTALALLALVAFAPAAEAAQTCTGSIRTGLLHPLPRPLTITASRGLDDTANPQLTQSFVDGLRRAGQQPGKTGNVSLALSAEVISASGQHIAPQRSGGSSSFSNFDWMNGMPSGPSGNPSLRGAQLTMSVQLTDRKTSTISWLASIKCTVQTEDPNALAQELGEIIGRNVGQNFIKRAM
jgi:hypothetical protein